MFLYWIVLSNIDFQNHLYIKLYTYNLSQIWQIRISNFSFYILSSIFGFHIINSFSVIFFTASFLFPGKNPCMIILKSNILNDYFVSNFSMVLLGLT